MGLFLNPGNENFKSILNGIYVDKTGIIEHINNTINTTLSAFRMDARSVKNRSNELSELLAGIEE